MKAYIDENNNYWNFSYYVRKKIRTKYYEEINCQYWKKDKRVWWYINKLSPQSKWDEKYPSAPYKYVIQHGPM